MCAPVCSCFQAREAREREEAALAHQKRVAELEKEHEVKVAGLRKQLEEAEEQLQKQVGGVLAFWGLKLSFCAWNGQGSAQGAER